MEQPTVREQTLTKQCVQQAKRKSRQVLFKRAESYVNEYRNKEREEIRLKRVARSKGEYYVPAQPKVYFVIRLRGINNLAPKPKKILQLLRLLQINNGVFIKVTKATSQMLQLVEPCASDLPRDCYDIAYREFGADIAFGEPNLRTVRELVLKRGYGRINKQRIPLTDNQVVENTLGKFGIVSVEDIIHEVVVSPSVQPSVLTMVTSVALQTAGPNFKQVSNFLAPFKLCSFLDSDQLILADSRMQPTLPVASRELNTVGDFERSLIMPLSYQPSQVQPLHPRRRYR